MSSHHRLDDWSDSRTGYVGCGLHGLLVAMRWQKQNFELERFRLDEQLPVRTNQRQWTKPNKGSFRSGADGTSRIILHFQAGVLLTRNRVVLCRQKALLENSCVPSDGRGGGALHIRTTQHSSSNSTYILIYIWRDLLIAGPPKNVKRASIYQVSCFPYWL